MSAAMRKISDVVDLDEYRIRLQRARDTYRARMLTRWGWPATVHCPTCGDFGRTPETGEPCLACETGREIAEREAAERRWVDRCPRRFQAFTLDTHPSAAAVAKARMWIEAREVLGDNLIISGGVGTGKTGLAFGIVRSCYLAGKTVQFGTLADILDDLRPRPEGRPVQQDHAVSLDTLQRCHVLLLDDVGVEVLTDWGAEQFYKIVNERYQRSLPTIVTTNHSLDRLGDIHPAMGERIMSRLTETFLIIPMIGPDLRRSPPPIR